MREVPEHWLEERARLGHDRWDELWEGVLHVVPPPSFAHQRVGSKLHLFLGTRLAPRGIDVMYETGVFRPGRAGREPGIQELARAASGFRVPAHSASKTRVNALMGRPRNDQIFTT